MNRKRMSAKELAEYFEVSIRTIYRDVDILSMANIPVYTIKGKNGGIALMDHYVLNKSLISKEEQQQILMSLQSLSFTADEKINQTLNKLNSFFNVKEDNWLAIDYKSWSNNGEVDFDFSLFKEAVVHCQQLSFTYYDRNGKERERIVNPYKVMYKGADWYIYAYCTSAAAFRYFKINRMQCIKKLTSSFEKQVLPQERVELYQSKSSKVTIKVHKKMAHRVLDEMKNTIIAKDDHYFIASIEMNDDWLYSYLFTYLDAITVLEPKSVRMKMKETAQKIVRKYET